MGQPRGIVIATTALVAVTAFAGVAAAAVRTAPPQQTVVPQGGSGEATGVCPGGSRAVSGGFDSPDFTMEGSSTVRTTSVRAGKRAWLVDAAGLGNQAGRVVAYAYCERKPKLGKAPKLRIRTATLPLAQNGIGTVTARCLEGERAISGGFASPGFGLQTGSHVIPLTSRRSGKRAWRVDAANFSFDESVPTQTGDLVAYAYCRKGGPRVFARTGTTTVAGQVARTVDAYCPQGSEAVSGGFDANIAAGQNGISASGAISSVRLPLAAGWRNTVVSVSDGSEATATAFAYCQ
jgi:hypothetical protein